MKIKVTVSIGVASFSETLSSEEALIRAADKNLYRAKEEGRNRVVDGKTAGT
jgi:diguanylate cyclase